MENENANTNNQETTEKKGFMQKMKEKAAEKRAQPPKHPKLRKAAKIAGGVAAGAAIGALGFIVGSKSKTGESIEIDAVDVDYTPVEE